MEREKLKRFLWQNFLKALFESLKPFQTIEDKVNYLETLIEYLKGVYAHEDAAPEFNYEGNPFDSETFIRKNILIKYKEKAKPFVDHKLRYYFEKEDFLKAHLFEVLKINEPVLTEEEFDHYITVVHTALNNFIEKICTQTFEEAKAETETDVKALPEANEDIISGFKSQSKEYTRSRQILLFHFVLQLMNMTRSEGSIRKYAQFGHVLFAWPVDNIDNSGVYKMLKKAPYLKQDNKATLKDLEFIKSQFELVDSPEGMALVQKEINSLKKK